jgi:cell division cycle 20-like protein 1 (cofactor of APC complex)
MGLSHAGHVRPASLVSSARVLQAMSGLKHSPFGKRLRASQQDSPRRRRQRFLPSSTPSLAPNATSDPSSAGPDTPLARSRDYGDRFVPSRDVGDMRTSYHLIDDAGPSTPSKNRIIPSESDALKGARPWLSPFPFLIVPQNKPTLSSPLSYRQKSLHPLHTAPTPLHALYPPQRPLHQNVAASSLMPPPPLPNPLVRTRLPPAV